MGFSFPNASIVVCRGDSSFSMTIGLPRFWGMTTGISSSPIRHFPSA
jgi:hypothetical protein